MRGQPLPDCRARDHRRIRHPAHPLRRRGGDRFRCPRQVHRGKLQEGRPQARRHRHRRPDPDRCRGAAPQRARHRRPVRVRSRQVRRGQRRRRTRNHHGGPWLGRGGPEPGDRRHGDERRRRRRHLQDRHLPAGQGARGHGHRRGCPAARHGSGRQDRAHRGGRPHLCQGSRRRHRFRHAAFGQGCRGDRRAHDGPPDGGDRPRGASPRKRGALPPAAPRLPRQGGRGDVLGRRLRVHLWPRCHELRRSRRPGGQGRTGPRRGPGPCHPRAGRYHPRHRDRRLPVHGPGFGQHDLHRADLGRAGAQRSGDRPRVRPLRGRDLAGRGGRGDHRVPHAARSRARAPAGGSRLQLEGLGDVPPARQFLQGRHRGPARDPCPGPSAGPGERRRYRRPARPAPDRGDQAGRRRRLDRRHRAQGIRLSSTSAS